jgi:hypothetical protein
MPPQLLSFPTTESPVAFLKATSRQLAISAWQARWHNANRRTRHTSPSLPRPPGSSLLSSKAQQEALEWHQPPHYVRLVTPCVIGSYTARFHHPTQTPALPRMRRQPSNSWPCHSTLPEVGSRPSHLSSPCSPTSPHLHYLEPRKAVKCRTKFSKSLRPASDPMNRPLTRDNLSPYLHAPYLHAPFCDLPSHVSNHTRDHALSPVSTVYKLYI